MGRQPREQEPGKLFHVMNRGVGGMRLFYTQAEYVFFLNLIGAAKREFHFLVHAFCLMPNHFHLLLEMCTSQMSEFMAWIEGGYARYFNDSRERPGHVFQGRFKALECATDEYYGNLLRYINLNPVKAGLISDPGEWPWSGHKQMVVKTPGSLLDRDLVLARLAGSESAALEAYRALFSGPPGGVEDAFIARAMFTTDEERKLFCPWVEKDLQKALEELALTVCAPAELDPRLLGSGLGPYGELRTRFCESAVAIGFSKSEIARFLDCSRRAVDRALLSSVDALA